MYNLGEFEKCKPIYKKIIAESGNKQLGNYSSYSLAFCYYNLNEFKTALKFFEKIYLSKHSSIEDKEDSLFRISKILYNLKQYDNAILRIRTFIKKFHKSQLLPDIYIIAGKSYLKKKNYYRAIANLNIVIKKYSKTSNAGEAAFLKGSAYYLEDRFKSAMKTFESAIIKWPESPFKANSMYFLAECMLNLEKYSLALKNYKKLIKEFPDSKFSEPASLAIGEIYEMQKSLH